jgi:hypothetical protein
MLEIAIGLERDRTDDIPGSPTAPGDASTNGSRPVMGNARPTMQHIPNLVPQFSRPGARARIHSGAEATGKGATVLEGKGFTHNPVILMFRPSGRKAQHDTAAPPMSRASTTRRQISPRRVDGGRIASSDCRDHRPR